MESAEKYAKFWLDPILLAESHGYLSKQLKEIRELIQEYEEEIRRKMILMNERGMVTLPKRMRQRIGYGVTRRKGDLLKMGLAAELRKQTAMSMAWIAKELNAGAPKRVRNAMRRLQDRGAVGKRE